MAKKKPAAKKIVKSKKKVVKPKRVYKKKELIKEEVKTPTVELKYLTTENLSEEDINSLHYIEKTQPAFETVKIEKKRWWDHYITKPGNSLFIFNKDNKNVRVDALELPSYYLSPYATNTLRFKLLKTVYHVRTWYNRFIDRIHYRLENPKFFTQKFKDLKSNTFFLYGLEYRILNNKEYNAERISDKKKFKFSENKRVKVKNYYWTKNYPR